MGCVLPHDSHRKHFCNWSQVPRLSAKLENELTTILADQESQEAAVPKAASRLAGGASWAAALNPVPAAGNGKSGKDTVKQSVKAADAVAGCAPALQGSSKLCPGASTAARARSSKICCAKISNHFLVA